MNQVVAVTATFRRPQEVARLLAALEKSSEPLHGTIVVDNASDIATRGHVEKSAVPHRYEDARANLGCGGGLKLGEEIAFREFPNLTHIWILDDDTVPEPDTLRNLLGAMQAHHAGAACPQASDAEGNLNWFPGLLDRNRFDILRTSATPAEFIARGGSEPGGFSWATGVSLLVSREALSASGLHRDDFWVRGEDLDFSLRITTHVCGIYVPKAHLAHLPPGGGRVVDDLGERMKHAAMLQNCAYLMAHTRHGRRLARHWPGNAWRHLRRFGIRAVGDVLTALRLGAVSGQPAGSPAGDHFRKRLAAK